MSVFSRRAVACAILLVLGLGLAACGQDDGQRQAFIAFLQTRIIDKPGLHIPVVTDKVAADIGPYAAQYKIMSDFHTRLDASLSDDLGRAMAIGNPRSLQELADKRGVLPLIMDGMARMKVALDKDEADANAAHAALKQPADLKPVYDAAFDRMVTKPAAVIRDIIPLVQDALRPIMELAAFLDAHRDEISYPNGVPASDKPLVQSRLMQLLEATDASSKASEQGKARLRAMVEGH